VRDTLPNGASEGTLSSDVENALTFRTIDPVRDARLALSNHVETCRLSFGHDADYRGASSYLSWLRSRIEEYPDGHVMAYQEGKFVGQLELQVPYGATAGYVNLFYVAADFRGFGFGQLLHQYADLYFRSWEASRIDLHVSPTNERAVGFYRKMGYKLTGVEPKGRTSMWLMSKRIECAVTKNASEQ
jgi:ribosomal protein S18 acetylase RimI-like enzyme